jgi:hypothetical protein
MLVEEQGAEMERALLFAAGIAVCAFAQAGDTGALAGTTGTGSDIVSKHVPDVDARAGYSALRWSNTASFLHKADATLFKVTDFEPLMPALRLTGGLFHDTRFEASTRRNMGLGSIIAKPEAGNRAAPYFGLGTRAAAGVGASFYADAGVMLMGLPNTAATVDCTGLSLAQCLALQNQAANEQTAFRAYPALNIGVMFGF